MDCQNTARPEQKFPGKLVGSWRSLRTCIYNTHYDLVHLQITNSARVCSVHFMEADFKKPLTGKRVVEKHAVPSMFRWSRSPRKKKISEKSENHRVHECDYLIEAWHRPLLLSQVNIVVGISLNIPWLKSSNNYWYFYVFDFNP